MHNDVSASIERKPVVCLLRPVRSIEVLYFAKAASHSWR